MASRMFCGADTTQVTATAEGRLHEGTPNEVGQYPPLLVLDDWDTASACEKRFIYEVSQQDRYRVMMLVLTDNKNVAWNLCQQNGFQRIVPLLDWDKERSSEMVKPLYDFTNAHPSPFDKDGCLDCLSEGMTPLQARETAAKLVAGALTLNVSSGSQVPVCVEFALLGRTTEAKN